jgi:hypothetical protein
MKSVVNAGTAKMMDSTMGNMGMGPMMNEGMGSMMKEGMGPMMMGGMGPMIKTPGVATGVATGAVVSVGSSAGKSVIGKFFTHPLVLFGLGVAVGYYIHKYRKSIISTSDEAQQ